MTPERLSDIKHEMSDLGDTPHCPKLEGYIEELLAACESQQILIVVLRKTIKALEKS